MTVEHHPLLKEFPEYHDRIHELKVSDAHFKKLFDEYHEVDREVYRMDENIEPVSDDVIHHAENIESLARAAIDALAHAVDAAGPESVISGFCVKRTSCRPT